MLTPIYLVLANGTVLEGESFGAVGDTVGEIVFATGMTGYIETLTDPSYYGQIVVQTFPQVGNYGIIDADFESTRPWLEAYIVREACEEPSNFRCEGSLDAFLKKFGIPGISGIDTRHLTKIIRESGVMNGKLTSKNPYDHLEEILEEIRAFSIIGAVEAVTCKRATVTQCQNEKYRVVLMDFGSKENIKRNLLARGCTVQLVPAHTSAEEIISLKPDGIMLSNGPGDPAENVEIIETIRSLLKSGIPMFGICLGHQLTALAAGAKTVKLKYGHRGGNQPVKDLFADKVYITSQNHGYAVDGGTLPAEIGEVSHINLNDGTCEGVRYKNIPVFTVQFHPEAACGPQDTQYLFDEFVRLMEKEGRN